MVRKAMFLLVILFLVSPLVHAQETFTVSGEVSFSKDADIYLLLKTKEEQKQDSIPSSRTIIIKLTAEQKTAKKSLLYLWGRTKGNLCHTLFSGYE